MIELLAKNWRNATAEVLASVVGSIGIVVVIAIVLSLQTRGVDFPAAFSSYFSGGQISLLILSISGIIFIALRRHGRSSALISVALYVLFVVPTLVTAVVVGMNPGFKEGLLSDGILDLLWIIFIGLHILWLIILLLEPVIPSAQEAGEEQNRRVRRIKEGAASRG